METRRNATKQTQNETSPERPETSSKRIACSESKPKRERTKRNAMQRIKEDAHVPILSYNFMFRVI